jgi:tetratricopeptide (TPR) repeat protein
MYRLIYPDLTTEASCRVLLERYPENLYVKHILAWHLRSQGRHDEAEGVLALDPDRYLKYDMQLLMNDERVRQNPDDPVAYLNRGRWHHAFGWYGKALSDYDRSISINSTIAYAFCCRANLRATCPDQAFRDGGLALEDALTAMKLAERAGELMGDWRHRLYLQVLAAAHAAKSNFEEAITIQSKALDLALTRLARSRISETLEKYQGGNSIQDQKGLVRCGYNPPDPPRGSGPSAAKAVRNLS